ncbi:type II secretion system F family protein [Candidatus Woesearchaeota archaeon]|nr:type II secretion system F family protein [Candidatus Woesearchaeota archaeon]
MAENGIIDIMGDLGDLAEQALLMRAWCLTEAVMMPSSKSLEVLSQAFPRFEKHFVELKTHLVAGKNLESYFRENVPPFHPLIPAFVSVGEATGNLDICFANLRDHLDKEVELREKGLNLSQLCTWKFYKAISTLFNAGLPLAESLKEANSYSNFLPKEVIDEILAKTPVYQSNTAKEFNLARLQDILNYITHLKDVGEEVPEPLKRLQQGKLVNLNEFRKIKAPQSSADFAEALAKHPKYFPAFVVEIIKFGEEGGILDAVLSRLADFYEKKAEYEPFFLQKSGE